MEASKASVGPRWTRGEVALVIGLAVVVFGLTLATANAYGPTYDEPHYASAGVRYADWWARALRGDRSAFRRSQIDAVWSLNHEHPPLQKVASGFAQRWLRRALPGLMAMRLPSALWLALAVCTVYGFTRGLWGRRGALFAALALASMPRVFAHAHLNALDMPIAAWFFVTTALAARALRQGSRPLALAAGASFGIALMAKLNAFFLPVLLVVWGLPYHRRQWPTLAAIVIIGPAVFFLGWPWLWIDPVAHARGYLDFHLGHAAYNVWYLGQLHERAPWHYPFVLTGVTTPTLLLLLALAGALRAWPRRGSNPEAVLLVVGLAVALIPNALPMSPKYNGARLFLPAFPFLAALAGGGFAWVQTAAAGRLQRFSGSARASALAAAALGALFLLPGVRGAIETHPYQLAYYNALVGGAAGATPRGFETIYWGQALQEAPLFLNRIHRSRPRVLVIPKGVIYLLEFQRDSGALRSDIVFTADEGEASRVDYILFQAMQSDYTELCWRLVRHAPPAWTVSVGETPVLLIYEGSEAAMTARRLGR